MRNAFRFFSIQWLWHSLYMECFRDFQWRVKEELAWFLGNESVEQNEFFNLRMFWKLRHAENGFFVKDDGLDWKAMRQFAEREKAAKA